MGLLRWFTQNWASTREPTHPGLLPLTVGISPEAVAEVVRLAIATMPRWRVASESATELKLTRSTRMIGFVDDVTVTIEPSGTGAILHATSKSRVGIGDFGQNRRNILELWNSIGRRLAASDSRHV